MYRLNDHTFVGTEAERTSNNFSIGDYFVVESTGAQYVKLFSGDWLKLVQDPLTVSSLTTTGDVSVGNDLTVGSNANITDSVTANDFHGDGANLTNLNGNNLQADSVEYQALETNYSIPLSDVSLYLPFNYIGNNCVNTNGHLGQAPIAESGSVVGVTGGKFGDGAVSLTQEFTDLIINPVFNDITTGWGHATGDSANTATRTTDYYLHGDGALLLTTASTAYHYEYSTNISVSASTDYTVFASNKQISGSGYSTLRVWEYDGSGAYLLSHTVSFTSGVHDWEQKSISFTTHTSAASIKVILEQGDYTDDAVIVWDDIQLTQTSYQLPFRYGDMQGCSWTGTPHASTTSVTMSQLKYAAPVDITQPHTFVTYARSMTVTHTAGRFTNIAHYGDYYTNNSISLMWLNPTTIALYTKSNSGTWLSTAVGNLDPTIYHQFGWIRDDTRIGLIVDGVVRWATTATADLPSAKNANDTIEVGGDSGVNGKQLNGDMVDFIVAQTALPESTIKAIYDSGVPICKTVSNNELSVSYNTAEKLTVNRDGIAYNGTRGGVQIFLDTPVTHSVWDGSTTQSSGNHTLSTDDFNVTTVDLSNVVGLLLYVSDAAGTAAGYVSATDSSFTYYYSSVFSHSIAGTNVIGGLLTTPVLSGNFYIYTLSSATYKIQVVGYIV